MLLTISVWYVYLLRDRPIFDKNLKNPNNVLVSFGLIVTEVCCHKINMNTKEKDIIKRILKVSRQLCGKIMQNIDTPCMLTSLNNPVNPKMDMQKTVTLDGFGVRAGTSHKNTT